MTDGGDGLRPDRGFLLRSLLAAVLIVVLTAGASATAALLKIDDILPDRAGQDIIADPATKATKPGRPQTILLLGSDRRYKDEREDGGRSDTLMLVRLDADQRATTVMSLPRDLKVEIPGHGVDKINEAYALGGPRLTIRTIKRVTGLDVNHVVNVNFGGFRAAVQVFGCFYVDVDRRYFHSNVGVPIGQRYDAIDIRPGYQRLCGVDALDYVRYRHGDTDLTRAARQQDFLRAAKDQVSTNRIIDDLEKLSDVVARYTQTDRNLASKGGFLRLAKLALFQADNPVRQIPFPGTPTGDERGFYVEATPDDIDKAVEKFLTGGGPGARRPLRATRTKGALDDVELVDARRAMRAAVRGLPARKVRRLGFPLHLPRRMTPGGRLDNGENGPALRLYEVDDRDGAPQGAYRLVVAENAGEGQFYGVQGTSWRSPPLLAHPSAIRRIRGRRLELFRTGSRLRFVAWRTDQAAYWISNTLNQTLSNDEMLAIATSLAPARR